jgi:MFS family permease
MDAGGYGVLLAALGVGAVAGALLMSRLRARISANQRLIIASVVYALVLAVVALVRNPVVVTIALIPAGTAWMIVLSNLNADVQLFLPRWVRARGLSTYQIVFFGGQAIGAALWGVIANEIGLVATFLIAAALTAAGAATARFAPLLDARHLNREPAAYWPEPQLAVDPDPAAGPVVITVTYPVAAENRKAFLEVMKVVRRSRMRTGAVQWGIFVDGEAPERVVEVYVVPTWDEHLRQHTDRLTGADQDVERRARALTMSDPEVVHLLPVEDP